MMILNFMNHTLGLWFVYRIAMWLKGAAAPLKAAGGWKLWLAYLFIALAYLLDMAYTLIVGTILFLDPPRELTFTARLKRYRRGGGYAVFQLRLADWFCEKLLNPYDPSGKHC